MPMRQEVRPNIDIAGSIGGLGDALQQGMEFGQKRRVDKATRAALASGLTVGPDGLPDYMTAAGNILAGGGDTQTALTLARLAEAQNERNWQHNQPDWQTFDGNLYNFNSPSFRQAATGRQSPAQPQEDPADFGNPQQPPAPDQPAPDYQPPAPDQPAPDYQPPAPDQQADASQPPPVIAGRKKPRQRRMGLNAEGQQVEQEADENGNWHDISAPKKAAQKPLSEFEKKTIKESLDQANSGDNTVSMLEQALVLSDQAYEGPTASTRGYAASNLPDMGGSRNAGKATEALNNIVTRQALEQLRTIFQSNPTEGERAILLEIQGSVNQSNDVRKDIYRRAIKLAKKRAAENRSTAAAIRNRTYFSGDDGSEPAAPGALENAASADNPPEFINGKWYIEGPDGLPVETEAP
jgi:hypothetical protein